MAKQINLRLDEAVHRRLSAAAKRNHRSLNGQIEWSIEQELERDETFHGRRTVLVGDTYETPEDAAQYAKDEAEALRMLGADETEDQT